MESGDFIDHIERIKVYLVKAGPAYYLLAACFVVCLLWRWIKMIPNEPPWIVEIDGIQFAAPEAVLLLLKAVSEERDSLLAVARAAKGVLWTNNDEMIGETSFHKELRAALAAVEDLL